MNVIYSLFLEVRDDPFGRLPKLLRGIPDPLYVRFDEMPRPFTRATISLYIA